MIICGISDTHRRRPVLPEADLLIHAGDLGASGSAKELLTELEWLVSLKPQFPLGIVYVPGNHDIALDIMYHDNAITNWMSGLSPYAYQPERRRNEISPSALMRKFEVAGIHVLVGEALEIEGVKMYGLPYSPIFHDWAFMYSEDELAKKYKEIPEDTQLLISHAPAQGLRDFCANGHVGSSALRWVLDNRLPDLKALICGHIHEGAGAHHEGRFLCWNTSVLDGQYQGFNEILTVDTTDWKTR